MGRLCDCARVRQGESGEMFPIPLITFIPLQESRAKSQEPRSKIGRMEVGRRKSEVRRIPYFPYFLIPLCGWDTDPEVSGLIGRIFR